MIKTGTVLNKFYYYPHSKKIDKCLYCNSKLIEISSPFRNNFNKIQWLLYKKCNSCSFNYLILNSVSFLKKMKHLELVDVSDKTTVPPLAKIDPIDISVYDNHIEFCTQCGNKLSYCSHTFSNFGECILRKCSKCKINYLDRNTYNKLSNRCSDNETLNKINVECNYYNIKSNEKVTVYKSINNSCKIKHDKYIVSLPILLENKETQDEKLIYGFHCKKCNSNFISIEPLSPYVKQRYIPKCNCYISPSDGFILNDVSTLGLYGYTAKEGELSTVDRHKIINYVLKNNLMSRMDIISLLEFLINLGTNNLQMKNACKIWHEDINYVYNCK